MSGAAKTDWSWRPPAEVAQAIRRGDAKTHWKTQAERRAAERDPFEQAVRYVFTGGRGHADRG